MTRNGNPYAPPAASVAEFMPAKPAERPREVTRAVRLFWVVLTLRLLSFCLSALLIARSESEVPVSYLWTFVAIASVTAIGFSAWIFIKTANGRNWARVICLLLTVLNFASAILEGWQTVIVNPTAPRATMVMSGMAVDAIATVLDFYALFLLFTKAAAPWFAPGARALER